MCVCSHNDDYEEQPIPLSRRHERADDDLAPSPTPLAWALPLTTAPLAPALAPVAVLPYHTREPIDMDLGELLGHINMPDALTQDFYQVGQEIRADLGAGGDEWWRLHHLVYANPLTRDWLGRKGLPQLLVQGGYSKYAHVSAMSVFCHYLEKAMSTSPKTHLALVFFCGLHTDLDNDPHAGGRAMIRSFICQLLRSLLTNYGRKSVTVTHRELAVLREPSDDDPEAPREPSDDLDTLYVVFSRLIRMVPRKVQVCCLVDGVGYYEREEFLPGLERALKPILQLSTDLQGPDRSGATLRVLLTSPMVTANVCWWIPQASIVTMADRVQMHEFAPGDGDGVMQELMSTMRQ